MPYLARVLGASGFGKIAFASAIVIWVQTVTDWGFNFTATRDVARFKHNIKITSYIFSTVLWARIFLSVISFIFLLLAVQLVPGLYESRDIILVTFLMVPSHILFPDWFFQAIEKMKFITIFNIISKLFFTISIFFFIKDADDYILQPLLVSLGYMVAGIASMIYILRYLKITIYKPSYKRITSTILRSTNVFLSNIMPNLYNSFSYILLGIYTNQIYVGYYEAGRKLPSIVYNQFLMIISRVFFPYFSRKGDRNHIVFAIFNIVLSIILTALLYLTAPFLIKVFFGEEFLPAVKVLRITSVSIVFHALNLVYVNNYLLTHNKDKIVLLITFISSIIGFVLSFPLIKEYNYIGASISYMVATILMGILPLVFYFKFNRDLLDSLKYVKKS